MVGSITGSLTELRIMTETTSKRFRILRLYLQQNDVSTSLSIRIQKAVEQRSKIQQKRVALENVEMLKFISDQMKADLHYEILYKYISVHPFLLCLRAVASAIVRRLANTAFDRIQTAYGDALFQPGERAAYMYTIIDGQAEYVLASPAGDDLREIIEHKEVWVAEAVLWTPTWLHLGAMTACRETEWLCLSPERFCNTIEGNPEAYLLAAEYSGKFLGLLNGDGPHSDLHRNTSVTALSQTSRVPQQYSIHPSPTIRWSKW